MSLKITSNPVMSIHPTDHGSSDSGRSSNSYSPLIDNSALAITDTFIDWMKEQKDLKGVIEPKPPLRERIRQIGPEIGETLTKIKGLIFSREQTGENLDKNLIQEQPLEGTQEINPSIPLKEHSASERGKQRIKTIFRQGKSLAGRGIDRIGERGKDRNVISAVRALQGVFNTVGTASSLGASIPTLAASLGIVSNAASVALAPIGFFLAGLISYTSLKKLCKMDSPLEVIREHGGPMLAKFIPSRIEGLQSIKKKLANQKMRTTQYAVTKRELARLKVRVMEGTATPSEIEKFQLLRVVHRKLRYRRISCALYLSHAAILTVATACSFAALFGGPAAPILLGIGIGLGIGGLGCFCVLRLGIFGFRRIRRAQINDTPYLPNSEGGNKNYIRSDDMRRYLRARLQADHEAGVAYPNLRQEILTSKDFSMDNVQSWSREELAIFLLMRGNKAKTKWTIKDENGKISPGVRKVSAENFRDTLFEKAGSNSRFNGAWKKAFGG